MGPDRAGGQIPLPAGPFTAGSGLLARGIGLGGRIVQAFFKEQLNPIKLVALDLTLLGVAGVSFGAGQPGWAGGIRIGPQAVIFGLLSGFSYSLYYIFGKHFSLRYTSANLFVYMLPIGAIGLWPGVDFVHKNALAWIGLGFLAGFSAYGAFFFYYQGLKYLEATRAAISATFEPVVAAVIAYLWWGEQLSLKAYWGSGLILVAVLLMVLDSGRLPTAQRP